MNRQEHNHSNRGLQMPDRDGSDLRGILGECTLVKLALEAVQALDQPVSRLKRRRGESFEPRMMLTLLGYCYASGIYGSEQIAQAIRDDVMVRYICARTYPDAEAIRRFRKEQRDLVRRCLRLILQQAWGLRLDHESSESYSYQGLEHRLHGQLDAASHHRLEIASFIDLMEDED